MFESFILDVNYFLKKKSIYLTAYSFLLLAEKI